VRLRRGIIAGEMKSCQLGRCPSTRGRPSLLTAEQMRGEPHTVRNSKWLSHIVGGQRFARFASLLRIESLDTTNFVKEGTLNLSTMPTFPDSSTSLEFHIP
jgi:hypothetical protein